MTRTLVGKPRGGARNAGLAVLLAGAGVALTACSQVAALAPVSGDKVTSVAVAAKDVLLEKDVAVLVWPVCETTTDAYTCTGSTVDGKDIAVRTPKADVLVLTVTVGGAEIFTGPVQDVLDQAAEATS